MDWVKLAVQYYIDPKVRGLDDAAELMFVRGLARAGELGQEGFIPEADLGLLTRRRRWGSLVKALVDAGLWSPVSGGYVVSRWAEWNSAADALAARRQADRERQRKRRQKQQQESRDNEDVSRDVTAPEGEVEIDTYLQGGSNSRTAPGDGPPPRRCPKHEHVAGFVSEPCGACAEARRAHDAWKPPDPQAQHQRALLAKAAEGNQRARELAETEPDRDARAKVIQIREHHRLPGRSA